MQSKSEVLSAFVAKPKFLPENFYFGAPTEQVRLHYEELINSIAIQLLPLADAPDPKPKLMQAFKAAFPLSKLPTPRSANAPWGILRNSWTFSGLKARMGCWTL